MAAFRFRLRQVREWRAAQLELEEEKLRQLGERRRAIELEAVQLNLVKDRAEAAVREAHAVEAADLWALAGYRQRVIDELRGLAGRRLECERQLAGQRQKVLEAQRQCRLLEKLEQRRQAEARKAADRELESLAADSFLARWKGAED